MQKLTGVWKQTSKAGTTYYTGKVGNTRFLLFKNEKRPGRDNDPDLTLSIAKVDDAEAWTEVVPAEGEVDASGSRAAAGIFRSSTPSVGAKRAAMAGHAPAGGQPAEPSFDDMDDEIPF